MSFDYSTIGKTSSRIATDAAEATSKKSNSSLDQADFLKLLTTQLQNQDPSSPVDNNQMVTTMSQLSVVENLSTISNNVDNVVNAISSSSALSASSLVGRSVLVDSKTAFFDGTNPVTAQIDAGEELQTLRSALPTATAMLFHLLRQVLPSMAKLILAGMVFRIRKPVQNMIQASTPSALQHLRMVRT